MAKRETGPRGGETTVAPSGWHRTSVYLRKDQIRTLKLAGIDEGMTMSDLLRRAIDLYFEKNASLSHYQRATAEAILREQFVMPPEEIAEFLTAFEGFHPDDDD